MERERDKGLGRDRPIEPSRTALLVVDVQNWGLDAASDQHSAAFLEAFWGHVVPNLERLIDAARGAGIEVVYTVVENETQDGRDRSLDYKLTGFFVAKGSVEAQVIDQLAPGPDELVIPKTSSSLFNSTNFDYLMRNIGIDTIIATGVLTDQCVDHTIRDGADRGFYMICASDACCTESPARHEAALSGFGGYCRTLTTDELLAAIA
ncbi:MAG: isochorismatase family cysteine hydrolase [Alphaproteobacteria bacterium]|jgi:nicotinamidase-related amidase|nr:isochorismatase family cysteine hydrolase [Alphaproteobacteria bacterium]